MTKKKKNLLAESFIILWKILWFIIKIPYYIIKGIVYLIERADSNIQKNKIVNKRNQMKPLYQSFKIIETEKGDFTDFEKEIFNSSKIGIVLGARGSGKTAIGIKLLENAYAKTKRKCFAIGFPSREMPTWIHVVKDISEIENNSIVLIDEGGIMFSSRESMSKPNKLLSDLILISRHKSLSILFISQNSSNLEVNVLRQADFLIFKPSSLLQKDFERKIVQKIYDRIEDTFDKLKHEAGVSYIYSNWFKGFVSNPLPSFWKESISKAFR